ncbi:helix-turn-helix domain-containing protein [Hymenobacter sp. BRD67]|uniref:AlbA family DNA-binding domain-containing protein n=1 Tax=Hymenobacter sp. BRD67 TaxID=2675877 RepID=UPI0020B8A9CD|nr:ATP-binding protein [Hymenobacter sp. BRD67]
MNLRALISQGEGERLEFKKKTTHPTRIARTLASLANTHGGQVLVGVDDDGRVVGVRDAEEEMFVLREAAAHYIDPPLTLEFREIETEGEHIVLVIKVAESHNKPHRAQIAPASGGATCACAMKACRPAPLPRRSWSASSPQPDSKKFRLTRMSCAYSTTSKPPSRALR